ncbi:DsbA family protein [Gordonia hydrophobica]|uniref:Thioredoxin domain-containing protein n=1 Tax=Gordonia hydrophobica TaxID=40516 RepID=A0ABZ2U6K8_9ACTN|nr:thioredoxin domain-containing protein [Gordonia hydrophobica]MBM7365429.1 protein-disulfide isomerase [Gordonia hydrophobica]
MRSTRRSLLVVALAVIAAVAVVLAAYLLRDSTSTPASPAPSTTLHNTGPAGDVPRRAADDPMVLGDDDAPVTLVVFSELTCPYCTHFATEIQPKLEDRYVATGRLRIEWRDAPTSGPTARLTARAGRAAAAQDRFWPFMRTVVRSDHQASPTIDTLVRLAETAGVTDLDRFRREATSDVFDAEIDADLQTAQRLFIPPSPAFWVDGTPLLSGLPLRAFTDVIDGKLALGG